MGNVKDVPYPEFVKMLEEGENLTRKGASNSSPSPAARRISSAAASSQPARLPPEPFKTQVNLQYNSYLQWMLEEKYKIAVSPKSDNNYLASALLGHDARSRSSCSSSISSSASRSAWPARARSTSASRKARMLARDKNKITFKDVAGVEEAKEEVTEIVEFLQDPKKFQKLGGRIPKGVLMVGAPGTGKTLLANAIAGEADVPFFSISGSDFVEMFVGVGASRVRDMFEQGKKTAPCLIFIDEIDAVGRHRGHGMGGGHDEREQTLNALLVEMDGFDTQEGVIIIAATNRPDVLDPALLRPGRFDRQVTVPLPDVKGREEILRVHAKKVKLAEDVDLSVVARGTPGYQRRGTGQRHQRSRAARRPQRPEGDHAARTRGSARQGALGPERRSLAMSDKEKENTAYHEAGHALLMRAARAHRPAAQGHDHPARPVARLDDVSARPRTNTRIARTSCSTDSCVIMGGRVAEELIFGDVTNGARGDIRQATGIARKMVCEWGMSEKMGMVEYGEHEDYVFLGRDLGHAREYSEATAQEIDEEVRKLCDDAYVRAHASSSPRIATSSRSSPRRCSNSRRSTASKSARSSSTAHADAAAQRAQAARPSEPPPLKREEGTTIAPDYPPRPDGSPGVVDLSRSRSDRCPAPPQAVHAGRTARARARRHPAREVPATRDRRRRPTAPAPGFAGARR